MRTGYFAMKCGLLGERLSHSYSPQIHSLLSDYQYKLYEKKENELEAFLKTGDFAAINVTIPYKTKVIPFLDEIDGNTARIGAVNTVVRKNGRLYGYNTDYFGFSYLIKQSGIEITGKKIIILGSGGSRFTASAVISDMGAAEIVVVSRTGEVNYDNITQHNDADVIINTTPVGMYPKNGVSPVNLDHFTRLSGVVDIVFNPARTKLMLDAECRKIPAAGGLPMLAAQAAQACGIFLDLEAETNVIPEIVRNIDFEMKNIILVGMPGSGKSTVGALIAKRLGREFFDSDDCISEVTKRSPSEIITSDGEQSFREAEHKIISDLGKKSGAVISTGGGVVTRDENYFPLHQNGTVIFLERDLKSLDRSRRPLSQKYSAEELYAARIGKYHAFSDIIVSNDTCPEVTADTIIAKLQRSNS